MEYQFIPIMFERRAMRTARNASKYLVNPLVFLIHSSIDTSVFN